MGNRMVVVKLICEFRKPLLIAIGCLALTSGRQMSTPCNGQDISSASPAFIAATIKPSDPNRAEAEGDIGLNSAGSFDAKAQSLKELIEFANSFGYYDVDRRIIGGPKWLGTARFDIVAKCDEDTARAFGKMPLKQQLREEESMVQALLADRFKLRAHQETRSLPVFALVLARGGSRMKPSAREPEEPNEANGPVGNWKADGVTMKELADQISRLPEIAGRIVVDKTDLKGKFDFTLKWIPDPTMGAARPGLEKGVTPDSSAPSLLTALAEQLGLKLESSKEPVDVVVIDSAELPSAN
jgi:uncharacterized protein (TIGR03435 family)